MNIKAESLPLPTLGILFLKQPFSFLPPYKKECIQVFESTLSYYYCYFPHLQPEQVFVNTKHNKLLSQHR